MEKLAPPSGFASCATFLLSPLIPQVSCTRDIAGGGDGLRRAALGLAGAVAHNKELRRGLNGEEIRGLLGAVCACSEETGRDMQTRAKCMWFLAMQTFSGAQVTLAPGSGGL